MFADNGKVSLRQLSRLLVFDIISVSGLIVPRIAVSTAGRDGIIAIVLGIILALIYSWILLGLTKNFEGNYLDFSSNSVGRILTFIIGLLYIVKLFACCVFVTRLFSSVINETLLEDTDPRLIIFMLILISGYAASKGIEVRSRIAEVLYYIVIVIIVGFLIFGLGNVEITNLMPLLTEDVNKIIYGGYAVFLTFTILELILFIAPAVQVRKSSTNKEKHILYYVIKSIILVGIINILFFIVTVGILGIEETKEKIWSSVTIIQIIKMPGGFIQRQDAFILGIWLLSVFSIMSGFIFYLSLITKKIFHIPSVNYLMIPYILLLSAASAVPIELEKYMDYFEKYMMYIGMPQSIIIPAFIVFVGKCKKLKVNKAIVKSVILFAILFSSATLTGCSDMTEIEDRNFVQSMGIDYIDDELIVYYTLPDLAALTGQSSTEAEKLMIELKGVDFWEIEEKYQLQASKKLDFSHLKAIILGNDLAKDSIQLDELLSYVENKYELGRNTLIFLAKQDAKDIISISGELNGGVGDYLENFYRVNLLNTGKKQVNVGNLIYGKNNKNLVIKVPIIKANERSVQAIGLGLFHENKLIYEVKEEEGDYLNIAYGYGKNNRLYLREKPEDNPEYVIKLNNLSRRLDFTWENDKPFVTLKIEGDGIVEKGLKDNVETSKALNNVKIIDIEKQCNEQIISKIEKSFKEILKENKIDFLNLYRDTSYKNRAMWLEYEMKQEQFLTDLEYSIQADVKIKQ